MKSRLHKIFLMLAAVVYAILWVGSNVGPFADLLRRSLVTEALVAALLFDLLWQLISREEADVKASDTAAAVRAELDRQGTMLASLMPMLGLKASGADSSMPAQVRRLVELQSAELTEVAAKEQIRIRGRGAVLDEALVVIRDSTIMALAKNHIPAKVWREDPAGRKVTEYLEQQTRAAAGAGLTRIHVYDESNVRGWTPEEWDAMGWLVDRHRGPMSIRLCSAAWDRRSADFENKGLVLGDPHGVGTMLVFEQPYIGTTEGRLVWGIEAVTAARHHVQTMLEHSEPWEEFQQKYR
ncbi:MAG TPA: hypothetical protein VLA36_04090 [Longimicrobiales bacterium]|nr:hypothetical protein [Longimicrobiales bacterium]